MSTYIYKKDSGSFRYTITDAPWPQPGRLRVAATLWGARREARKLSKPARRHVLIEEKP